MVERSEVYDGLLKRMAEQWTQEYYYDGSEHVFTADGVYKATDGKYETTYEVLSDTKIKCVTVIVFGDATEQYGEEQIYDYELNGDEFVLYGNYYINGVTMGHCNAVYFKRK